MKNIKKQWFTLVELIVVITILAILWSIAFISLQGYSSDARNSKRSSDLNSIISAMSTQLAQGQNILSFATPVANNANTWTSVAWTWVTITVDFQAGTINFASLPVKATDFQDPNGSSYVVWVTSKDNGRYELAATIEQGAGSKIAKVVWNYTPRLSSNIALASTWVAVSTWSVWLSNAAMFTIKNNADLNTFMPDDTVDFVNLLGASTGTGKIIKISSDWTVMTMTATWTAATTGVKLHAAETIWLINDNKNNSGTGNTAAETVTEAWTYIPY